jgi:hypothetical protein
MVHGGYSNLVSVLADVINQMREKWIIKGIPGSSSVMSSLCLGI